MKAPLLVGVRHDANYSPLLDRHCRERFTQEIFPLIDRDTLLLLEGAYRESYVDANDFFSFVQRWSAARFVGVPIGRPTIGWRDGRHLIKPLGQFIEETVEFALRAQKYTLPHIVLTDDMPATFAELADALLCSRLNYRMNNWDDLTQLESYRRIVESFAQFDRTMIKAAREWEKSDRHAIILCGNMHALSIHRKTAWPVISLRPDTITETQTLTRCFIATVLYPEAVCKKHAQ